MAQFNRQAATLKVRQEGAGIQRQSEPAIDSLNDLAGHPLLNSRPKKGVKFFIANGTDQSAQVRIRHGLGRAYQGWTVVKNTTPKVTFCENAASGNKGSELVLVADLPADPGADTDIEIDVLVY